MNSFNQHIQIAKFNAYKDRIEKLKSKTGTNFHELIDTIPSGTNQVPTSALINLGEDQIISQEWLSKQPPLDGFFEEGQQINPALKKMDDTKRQCWLDNGIYRYNELGSDWILTQLGASTIAYDDIIQLYHIAPGEENAEIMKNMGVVATGWRGGDGGRVERAVFAYLRSRSELEGGGMLAATLNPDSSDVDNDGFGSSAGMVPFGVMDKKVSA
ncbi:hypothetical protein H7169_03425 [Candidatus Gracilibacteria bacterium]|nr:hypothetical protein [Candidatus Gracilibacteria bacterium]